MEIWFKQKTRPRMNFKWIGKTINKKYPIQKFAETVKIKVKLPHVNKKPLARNGNLVQTKKLGLEWTLNGLGKPLTKNIRSKNSQKQ